MTSALSTLAAYCREIDLAYKRQREGAIYFLVDEGEIVYVGQTTCIEARIGLHLSAEDKVFDRAFFFLCDERELDAYEGALIRALGPRYCFSAPKDRGRDVEILARLGMEPDVDGMRRFTANRAKSWPASRRRKASRDSKARIARRRARALLEGAA